MKIQILRNDYRLQAYSEDDLEFIKGMKNNTVYMADVKLDRNPDFHRKYFKLIKIALENLPEKFVGYTSKRLRKELQMWLGYFEVMTLFEDGKESYVLDSISFENMDDTEFKKLYDGSINILCQHYLRGMTPEKLYDVLGGFF